MPKIAKASSLCLSIFFAVLLLGQPVHADQYQIKDMLSDEPCKDLSSALPLLGNWRSETDNLIISETWRKASTLSYDGQGMTFSKTNQQQVGSESLRLLEMGEGVFYLAKVKSNPLPVAFKLVKCSDTQWLFENKNHDFPKQLDYQLLENGKLSVKVRGAQGKGFDILFIKT